MVVRGQIINTSKRNSNREQVFTSWSRRRERSEHASEASSTRPEVYSSRSEHLPEAPKCIHPGMYDCLEYNGTYRRTKRVDNGVLDTLKRHLWTNRLEGWRKNIHPWADITRSTCNAGLCTAEADNANNQWKGEGMNFKLKRNFAKDQRSDGTKTKFLQDKTALREEWNSSAAGTEPVNL